MHGPNPDNPFPLNAQHRVCYLKNIIKNPSIVVGNYTYYDDPDSPENFEKNVLYHFDFIGDKLIIGKFCAIATGVKFIMNGANHQLDSFTTYPFGIFGNGWEAGMASLQNIPQKGNTTIGNDVWIGYEATIMPGINIGDGAIIASKSIVTKDVSPYTIVGGNPAKIIRQRFSDDVIKFLIKLKWWDWEIEKITQNIAILSSNDITKLTSLDVNH